MIEVKVYRKITHTNKYLDFNLHNPVQHNKDVVKTLLHRAQEIPTNENLREQEIEQLNKDLATNGYPQRFLQEFQTPLFKNQDQGEQNGYTGLPYVKGVL